VEIFRDQVTRLRADVQKKEEELRQAKRQLEKLEAAVKVLEAT
jgi:acetolactate synthase small subunit